MDYVLVHEFSQAFYMILTVTVWVKALINLVVAGILVDGIKQVRQSDISLMLLLYKYLFSDDSFALPHG